MSARSRQEHQELVALAWPILMTSISTHLLALVNAIWVGRLGTAELAAIGLASAAVFFVQALPTGLMNGLRTLVGNAVGAEDDEAVRSLGWDGLYLAAVMAAASLPLAACGTWLFDLLGGSDAVRPLAASYYTWRVVASPLLLGGMALTSWFQGRGDTRTPMVASLIANAANFVLDPLLIYGLGPVPSFGVAGAAMGAGLGQALALAYLAWVARPALGRRVEVDPSRWSPVWRLGAPTGVQYVLDVASYTGLSGLLAWAGDVHLAAHMVAVRLVVVMLLPALALGEAVGVIVAQRIGASRWDAVHDAIRTGLVQTVAVMTPLGLALVLAPRPLIAVFDAEAAVVEAAVPCLILYGLVAVVDSVAWVLMGALNGAGDTRYTMRVGLIAAWLVKVPLAGVFVWSLGLGALGIWLAIAAEAVFQLGTGWMRVAGRRWLGSVAPAASPAARAAG